MLSLVEYQAYANELQELGADTDQQIADATQNEVASVNDPDTPNAQINKSKQSAIQKAKSLVGPYQRQLKWTLDRAMWEIGENALHHYTSATQLKVDEDIVRQAIKDQYSKKYYGMNLNQRLGVMKVRLNRVIAQTAQTGVHNLGGVFSDPVPFGAQSNISKRLLQGTAIKLEQDIAKKVAKEINYPFVRWTLAKEHVHPCQCETYASYTDKGVKEYIAEHNLEIDPEGVFFIDDLPDPPHPNCQCEFDLIDDQGHEEVVPSHGRRVISRIRNLIRKLLRS